MNHLQTRFTQLEQESRVALTTFVTANDLDYVSSLKILRGLPTAGADVIELGMPFTDPMADGPAIQLANIRVLNGGQILARTLQMVRELRSDGNKTLLMLIGYFDSVCHYGVECPIAEAEEVRVDGLIVVDLPPEHNKDLCHPAQAASLDSIRPTIPTTDDQRLLTVLEGSSEFVYYMSVAGVTSANTATLGHVEEAVTHLHRHIDLPVGIGFGTRNAGRITAVTRLVDDVVVGSVLTNWIAKAHDSAQVVRNALALYGELTEGMRNAR